jgi:folate-binding protein YgfZ
VWHGLVAATLFVMTRGPFWVETPRDAVRVSGPDALDYLQGQVSQELRPLGQGASRWTLLLQPNGRIDVLARVWRTDEDTYVLDTDSGFGEELLARINRFRIRVKADVETVAWRSLAVRGTGESTVPDGAVVGWWDRDYDLFGPNPQPPAGVEAGSRAELEVARIEAGWPAMGAEIVPGEQIPGEIGVVPVAVDFRKGCYPGQELVERMDSRGAEAPRRLRILTVAEGSRPGDRVLDDGREVGVLTSVAGTRALGYVKRGVELGAAVRDT